MSSELKPSGRNRLEVMEAVVSLFQLRPVNLTSGAPAQGLYSNRGHKLQGHSFCFPLTTSMTMIDNVAESPATPESQRSTGFYYFERVCVLQRTLGISTGAFDCFLFL